MKLATQPRQCWALIPRAHTRCKTTSGVHVCAVEYESTTRVIDLCANHRAMAEREGKTITKLTGE